MELDIFHLSLQPGIRLVGYVVDINERDQVTNHAHCGNENRCPSSVRVILPK